MHLVLRLYEFVSQALVYLPCMCLIAHELVSRRTPADAGLLQLQ